MDSGNGGSLQSSSCGEDDFDSAFFHSSSSAATGAKGNTAFRPSLLSYSYNQFLDNFFLDSSSPLHMDATAPNTSATRPHCSSLRPSPSCTTNTFPSICITPSSSSPSSNNSLSSSTRSTVGLSPSSSAQLQEKSETYGATTTATAPPARGSKKRTRASRRAPTTVLNTDTSNFRALVQEFTGIPLPPFAGSTSPSPFVHSRLDAIHSDAGGLIAPPSYLIRPSVQKFQGPFGGTSNAPTLMSSPASCTGMITGIRVATNSISSTNTITTSLPMATSNIVNPTNNNNHQLPLPGTCSAGLDSQNHMFNFQSLQLPHLGAKYTSSLSSPAAPFSSSRLQSMPSSTDYGSGNLLFPPSLLLGLSEGASSSWSGHPPLGSINPQSISNHYIDSCKVNFSAAGLSETDMDKAVESAKGSRNEGMVESWICSSD